MGRGIVDGRPVVGENGDGGGVAGTVGQIQGPDLTDHAQIACCHSLLAFRDPTRLVTDKNRVNEEKKR